MKEKITLREYDVINEELLRLKINNYKDEFNELISFIEEFQTTRDNEDAYTFMSVKKNRLYGEYVTIRNYVGLIQLRSGFQIEVLPKIDMTTTNSDEENKKIFLKMLKSMRDFDGKTFNFSNLNINKMKLYEIFINLYLQETDRIVKKGLKSAYIEKEDNLKVLKGKLLIKENIKYNTIHNERFYNRFDEYNNNCVENKLIKATLLKFLKESESDYNIKLCKQLLSHFETIDASTNYDADLSKVVNDRNHAEYELVMNWSKVILKNKSFSTFSGASKSRALLFEMNDLFEAYVAKELKKECIDKDWVVKTQVKEHYLFNPDRFRLIPDIVIKTDGCNIVLDTKWKELFDDAKRNYGISQGDMYQMYAYSKKYDNAPVILLYPLNNEMQEYKDLGISYLSDDKVNVHIFFVDLLNMQESMKQLIEKIELINNLR